VPGIFRRILDIAKAAANNHLRNTAEEVLISLEKRYRKRPKIKGQSGNKGFKQHSHQKQADNSGAQYSPRDSTPKQVQEDLSLFNLKPPVTMTEIRKARNREFKKYHSDRFLNDPERFQVSKEIMQIYNAAYERLKLYYEGH
jgi:curved DNA-binding protein CbpA